jgi:exoribonuclease-2
MRDRSDLVRIAVHAMAERGLQPEFSDNVHRQLQGIANAAVDPAQRDLTTLPWCSIDNDDSRDLDQLTACEALPQGVVRLWVAIADVDALVKKDTAIDAHAQANTTSVYTSARIFPMLPERLSTDLTSLNPHVNRCAMVTEMVFNADATLAGATVYPATVRNQAQLAYDAVSAWLVGEAPLPAAALAVPGLDAQLHIQDALAQMLRLRRRNEGSLELETFQPRVVFEGETVVDIQLQAHNRARQLIEEFMIATNGCTARYLAQHGNWAIRRVVRSPERWLRIVAVAKEYAEVLPAEPDSKALEAFLARQRKADPLRFPDLSLVIVKLMGRGEYVVEAPNSAPIGHFGLALRDYTHSTAPNRRYPDLVTSRLVKAAVASLAPPYTHAELEHLALHCTRQEDAAQKVERQMRKSEAALLLETRIGQVFEGIVTGSAEKGVWVRVFNPPAEGKVAHGGSPLTVGQKVRVQLISTNVERGFIDFAAV